MKYKYYKCSIEVPDEYQSAGFIVKDNGKDPIEKLKKFFEDHKKWLRYDGVYFPLKQVLALENVNRIYQETIFGWERIK